jgi:DNA modification methylase
MKELSRMSDDEMDKIADKMSDYFLKAVEEDFSKINFDSLEKRLKIKYMRDDHSAIVLDGRKGVRIIVDHGISEQWSEINCKTEIKIFEKCGIEVTDHIIREKVYSYGIQREKKFYKELEKIPDSEWLSTTNVTRTISQDVLGQIEKTAASIGFTLENVLQLMAENTFITQLRSKVK